MTTLRARALQNVYLMLSYAFKEMDLSAFDEFKGEEFESIEDVWAYVLIEVMANQIKRGLHKEYKRVVEDGLRIRGKILADRTAKNEARSRFVVGMEYDELSVDCLLNQIVVSTALVLLQQSGVARPRRQKLRRLVELLHDVSIIDLHQVDWEGINLNRANRSYALLLFICRSVAESQLIKAKEGADRFLQFSGDQLHAIFEGFVREYYSRRFRSFNAASRKIKWDTGGVNIDLLPEMKTDITLWNEYRTLIVDTKFYASVLTRSYGAERFRSENLYQIHAYVTNYAAQHPDRDVSGMLLYAVTGEEFDLDREFTVSGRRMAVRSIDVGADWDSITGELDQIAFDFFKVTPTM